VGQRMAKTSLEYDCGVFMVGRLWAEVSAENGQLGSSPKAGFLFCRSPAL
jgi:hypothetical protein